MKRYDGLINSVNKLELTQDNIMFGNMKYIAYALDTIF